MPDALIVEDGSGLPGADSYLSLAEADACHARLGNTDWPAPPVPTDDDPDPEDPHAARKAACLRRAALFLDGRAAARVSGAPKNAGQGLLFPRAGAVDFQGRPLDGGSVPALYKSAAAEAALLAYSGAALAPEVPAGPLVRRRRTDALETEWVAESYGKQPVFGWLDLLLAPLFGPPASGTRCLRVERG